jgi:hypothetical protein
MTDSDVAFGLSREKLLVGTESRNPDSLRMTIRIRAMAIFLPGDGTESRKPQLAFPLWIREGEDPSGKSDRSALTFFSEVKSPFYVKIQPLSFEPFRHNKAGRTRSRRLAMIPCRSLPLDEEAGLYQSVFRAGASRAPLSILHRPSGAAAPSYQSRIVCYRCGCAGHRANDCSGPLPSIALLEAELEQDLDVVARRLEATGTYARDEFGTFQTITEGNPVPSGVQTARGTKPLNWSRTVFCVNCGEAGHSFTKCPKWAFSQFLNRMVQEFGPDPAPPNAFYEFFRRFWLNNSIHKRPHNEGLNE